MRIMGACLLTLLLFLLTEDWSFMTNGYHLHDLADSSERQMYIGTGSDLTGGGQGDLGQG